MRLHALTMTGIGPYAGTETIDFSRLSTSGRFLLAGPTGAGKSTVIDAIVFALYGDVAGDKDSSKDRLRSRLVDPATQSLVELVFSTSAGTYRVRRTPAYQRPKKRGRGMTTQNSTLKVWRLAGPDGQASEEVILRPDEAGPELRRAVGLTRQQFTQTIVLPQGRFAQFLRSSSAERHELLREVFGTHVYDQMQDWLIAHSRELAHQARQARDQASASLSQLASVLRNTPRDASSPGSDAQPSSEQSTASTTLTGPAGAEAAPAPEPGAGHGEPGSGIRLEPLEHAAEAAEGSVEAAERAAEVAEGRAGTDKPAKPVEPAAVDALRQAVDRTDPDLARVREVLSTVREQEDSRTAALSEQAAQAAQAHAEAQQALKDATDLSERLEQRARLMETKQALTAQQEEARQRSAALKAARAARELTAYIQARSQQAQDAAQSLEALSNHAAVLDAGAGAPDHDAAQPAGSCAPVGTAPSYPLPATAGQEHDSADPAVLDELSQALQTLTALPVQAGVGAAASSQLLELPLTTAHARARRQQANELRSQAGALTHVATMEQQLTQRDDELSAREQALVASSADLERTQDELDDLPEQREHVHDELTQARHAAATLPERRQELAAAQGVLEAARSVEEARRGEEATAQAHTRAVEQAQAAEQHSHALRTAWIAATAASLVSELREGHPCPVCGSCDHPAPAATEHEPVSRADLEAAEQEASLSREALTQAVRDHEAAVAALASARERSQGRSLAQAEAAVDDATAAVDQCQASAQTLSTLEEREATLAARLTELSTARADLLARREAEQTSLDQARQVLAQDTATVTASRGNFPSVTARRQRLVEQADDLEHRAERLDAAASHLHDLADATQSLAQALAHTDFTDLSSVDRAILPPARIHELDSWLQDYHARCRAVDDALTQPAIASLTGDEHVDLSAAQRQEQQARRTWMQAVQAHSSQEAHAATLTSASDQLTTAVEDLVGILADSAALVHVAELARGENPASTPLATWVLAERFQDVMSFANARLRTMSSGRYALVPMAEEKQSSRRRGLGLGIQDNLSGDVRDPRTLSGGESFYVSLALALALADVVTAESGGIQMDTLFIDEGFGSLDPETLEAVLGELTRLQDDGRVVGIVSHVSELRQQIPDQVIVSRDARGSHLRQVAP